MCSFSGGGGLWRNVKNLLLVNIGIYGQPLNLYVEVTSLGKRHTQFRIHVSRDDLIFDR